MDLAEEYKKLHEQMFKKIEEQKEYINLLEDTIYGLVVSEGHYIPKGLEHLFEEEKK